MSGWNPPPEGPEGWGDTGQGFGQPSGPGPGYGQSGVPGPDYGQPGVPGPGYGPPTGPGVPYPMGYGPQGYGPQGMGGYQPPGRRRGVLRWIGIGAVVVLALIIVAGVITYTQEDHSWKLTAPSTAAGLSRSTNVLDTLGLSEAAASQKSAVTKVPGYGTLQSTVSAAYAASSLTAPLVQFIGLNGKFSEQIELKSFQGAPIVNVNAGPHGGVAECAKTSLETFCQWSTTSTVGALIITSSDLGGGPVSTATADSLLIKMRNSVEKPA